MNRLLAYLTLVALMLSSMAALGNERPSIILYNGTVVTMTAEGESYEAIAIVGNRILSVGSSNYILELAGPETQLIDLQAAAVYPGFIDPHTHLLNDSWNRELSPIESQELALRYGITSAANMYTTPDLVETYLQMANRGDMRVRFSLYLIYNTSCGEVLGNWYTKYDPLVELDKEGAIFR